MAIKNYPDFTTQIRKNWGKRPGFNLVINYLTANFPEENFKNYLEFYRVSSKKEFESFVQDKTVAITARITTLKEAENLSYQQVSELHRFYSEVLACIFGATEVGLGVNRQTVWLGPVRELQFC